MKIGIIGAGNIGGTLGRHWVHVGHDVVFGVRSPGTVGVLVNELGEHASAGSPSDAAAAGEVVVFAGPFGAWPAFTAENGAALAGKVVIDASNPYPARDDAVAEEAVKSGAGSARFVAGLLPGSHVVKAFNTVYWVDLRDKAHAPSPRLAMPIAGDDLAALALAGRLATEAGFDPVIVGGLSEAVTLDPGSPIYAKSYSADQVRKALGL